MLENEYKDITVETHGGVGIIKVRSVPRELLTNRQLIVAQLNRPRALNAFGGKLLSETLNAVMELNEHPDTIFTVLTGEGRFFSAGADIRGNGPTAPSSVNCFR